ncbi:unnamed protein product [Schistocephalus solidus]|uniref:DCAF15_WD40 domain-containing protein n=1 Tax=Schistocephalus solidus TaxID=70667 RepID=A0A183TR83_SCHSO|nr:unnamed protein product [Schistocephalus solidus]
MFRLPNHSQRNLAYAHTSSALKLNPEQSRYVQQPDMKIQLQVCLGPDCRSNGLKANLTDPRGQALMVGFSDSFTLFNIFCWSTLNLIATTPEEPAPVQRTIALHSAWTYTCDDKDILVTRGRVGEPIVLCLPTSKESKEALANETDFKRIFKEARCNCSTPGVTFSAGFLHLPSNASLSDSFPIQCQLHECQWRFLVRIVKELDLFCLADGEPEPSNRTLRLHPLLTPECSQEDVYVAPGVRTQPVSICKITSKYLMALMASNTDKAYRDRLETMFDSVNCTSQPSDNVTFAKAHVRIPPNARPPVEYLVRCTLRDCEWSFKLKSLEEREYCTVLLMANSFHL